LTYNGHNEPVVFIAIAPNDIVISGGHTNPLHIWELNSGVLQRTLDNVSMNTYALNVSSYLIDATILQSWQKTNTTRNIISNESNNQSYLNNSNHIWSPVASVPIVLTGTNEGEVCVWDISTGNHIKTLKTNNISITDDITPELPHNNALGIDVPPLSIISIAQSTNVSAIPIVVAGDKTGSFYAWDIQSSYQMARFTGHFGAITSLCIVDNNEYDAKCRSNGRCVLRPRYVVSASADWTLRVWNLDTGEHMYTLEGHSGSVESVSVLCGGKSYSEFGGWQMGNYGRDHSNSLTKSLSHMSRYSVSLGCRNNFIVSGGRDGTVRIWGLESGMLHRTLEDHSDSVCGVSIYASICGRQHLIASGGSDSNVMLWDLGKIIRDVNWNRRRIFAYCVHGIRTCCCVTKRRGIGDYDPSKLIINNNPNNSTTTNNNGNTGNGRNISVVLCEVFFMDDLCRYIASYI
jgi:WD40 repeat protein